MLELLTTILKTNQSATSDVALLVMRTAAGALMLTHGVPKIKKLISHEPIQFFETFGLSERSSLMMAAFIEVFFSTCLILGFLTQLVVIPLLGTMLVAAFYTLKSQPFSKKELPILYLLIYVTILLGGGGKFSLDYLIFI